MDAVMTRKQAYDYAIFLLDAEIAEAALYNPDQAEALQQAKQALTLQDLDEFYTDEDAFYDSHDVARFMPADVKDALAALKSRLRLR